MRIGKSNNKESTISTIENCTYLKMSTLRLNPSSNLMS
jgi:hypothetical protein